MNRQTEINSETAADWVTKNPTENAELPTSPGVLIAKAPVGNGCLHACLRAGQKAFFEGVNKHRLCAFKARRQYGKTTTLATIALKRMCVMPNHTIIFGTARLNLATELVRKQDELVGITRQALNLVGTRSTASHSLKGEFGTRVERVPATRNH
jgi:hypothetical protein